MDAITVKLDTTRLDQIREQLGFREEQVVRGIAFDIEFYAKTLAPYRTGALSNSIYTVTQDSDGYAAAKAAASGKGDVEITDPIPAPSGDVIARVGPCVVYAAMQEYGGVVTPVKAKMLHWTDDQGEEHYAKEVHIPAHPYMTPAAEMAAGKFNRGETWKVLFE